MFSHFSIHLCSRFFCVGQGSLGAANWYPLKLVKAKRYTLPQSYKAKSWPQYCQTHYKLEAETQKALVPRAVLVLFSRLARGAPSVQFSSVAQLCPTLCDPMNCSTPGLPVHHQLPEFTQTHVHRVHDAIQPSHSLSSPSPPAPNPSQHQGLFQWVNSSQEVAKVLEFQL